MYRRLIPDIVQKRAVPFGNFLGYVGDQPFEAEPIQPAAFLEEGVAQCSFIVFQVAGQYAAEGGFARGVFAHQPGDLAQAEVQVFQLQLEARAGVAFLEVLGAEYTWPGTSRCLISSAS